MLTFKLTINDTPIDNPLILDKVEFTTNSNNRDLSVGDFLFTTCKLKFHNSVDIRYQDIIRITITDESGTEHPYGIYEPYNIVHNNEFSTDVELYAMPVITLMKEYTPLFPSSSYTTQTLLQELQLELGFTVATSDNFLIQSIPMGVIESDTGINLLSKIALQLGGNVFINREGKVEFKILSRNNFTIPSSQITQVTRGENEYSITQVVGKTGNGDKDTTYTSGTFTTDAHTLTVTSPYLTQSVTDRILTILQDVRYYAYKLKVFDFPLQANMYDMITFTHNRTTNENLINEITLQPLVENDDLDVEARATTVSFPIMNLKLTFSADGLIGEAESLVSSEASKDTGYKGTFTKRLEVIKNITQELDTKIEVIDGNVSSVINKTTALESDVTTVKNQQSSINQSLTNITNRVTANETTLANDYYTKTETATQIQQTATSVSQQVIREELGKIEVGARNYILKSNVETSVQSPTTTDNASYEWKLSQDTPFVGVQNKNDNAQFTISIWTDKGSNAFTSVLIGDTTIYATEFTIVQLEQNLFRYSKVFTVARDSMLATNFFINIICQGTLNHSSTIKNLQLEEGSVGTSYQRPLEDVIEDFDVKVEDTIANIVNNNQEIQTLIQQMLTDDFLSDAEKSDMVLIYKQITSQYNNILKEVTDYGEPAYFSTFTDRLTSSYNAFSDALNEVLNNNATSGKVGLQELLATYFDDYNSLLYVISQFVKSERERLESEIIQTNSSITQVITRVDDEVNTRKNFMQFSSDGLLLFSTINGETGKFRMLLSNNRLSFYEGNKEVAYMSNEKLYISKTEITTELKLGGIVARKGATNGFIFQADE